jgi:hypothetical protein
MLLSNVVSFIKENRHKGRREAFGFEGDTLKMYLTWAFSFEYLFLVFDNNEIVGVGVAYPLKRPFNGDKFTLFVFNDIVPKTEEHKHELCIMDWVATTDEARNTLVKNFKKRYPNWENQKKWGLQFEEVKEISNKYINLLNKIS